MENRTNGAAASSNVLRIALFRALYLGDMICVIPVVRALRKSYPYASISLVGLPWQKEFALRYVRYFDEFIEFPGWPGLPEREYDPFDITEFLRDMQRRNFDIVLQMQGNGALTNAMCLLWKGKRTVGLRKENDSTFEGKDFPVSNDDEHEVLRFLKLLDALGVPSAGNHLEFPISAEEDRDFLQRNNEVGLSLYQYVCMHPGSRDPKRRWPAEHFAIIGDHLVSRGYTVVLTGSNDEQSVIENVLNQMKYTAINSVTTFGPITLGKLGTLIKHARLLVSNDTGVSHIAAGLSIPSVVMFSPWSLISRWAPQNDALHHVVTAEAAKDPLYVWNAVQQQLHRSHSMDLLKQ